MLTTLIITFCLFGTNVHAGSTASSITTSTLEDVDVELAKIAATCLTNQDYEQLTGNIVRHGVARSFLAFYLVKESVATIGLAELRASLDFAPLPPWKHFNDTKPSEDELSATKTIEAYYDLKEPRSEPRSLDSEYLFERNMNSGIAYLDEKFPMIRKMFRSQFRTLQQQNPGSADRNIVDKFIEEFIAIRRKIDKATTKMHYKEECRKMVNQKF